MKITIFYVERDEVVAGGFFGRKNSHPGGWSLQPRAVNACERYLELIKKSCYN
jgi:hypothetical protein